MISSIILTKNEEKNIKQCIESLLWCDEIIIIDDNSEDKTISIVEAFKNSKIKIYTHALDNDFSAQRNFGLEKAEGEWVLFIDADEVVSHALSHEISSSINLTLQTTTGYFLKRRDNMWGRKLLHGEAGNMLLLRLAKKNAGKWEGMVHEHWVIDGKTDTLKHELSHFPHQTLKEFLQEINRYTTLRAKELHKKGSKVYWWSIIFYPKVKFIMNYFAKQGFRDGMQGFLVAMLMSFHSFLVRGKLWVLSQKR